MNNVVLIGRLVRDPELRYLPSLDNRAVANFTLAVDRNYSKQVREEMESKGQPTADFIRIQCWGKTAELAAQYLVKGRLVAVSGSIRTGSYEAQDGTRRYTTDVNADRVQFLEWGDSNRPASNDSYGRQSQDDMQGGGLDSIDGFYNIDNDDIPF